MYEYKFEVLELPWLSREPKEDYHEIIRQAAREGWELVQIFAPPIQHDARPIFYELIFKRELPGQDNT